ncbi:unnamed protein product [Ilex paraguariensis]|uniref:DNA polymerase n=1 Tax=Ilex paraguariensis TaxID=185542 RepID=A0ABC8TF11_9AQUA
MEYLDRNLSYHPQDVSRAAKLLLGGAVLDKALQPHESHIPFLLQFLVDYNLSGMGHLHLSKIKFRQPVPDVFIPKKTINNGQHMQQTDKPTCMSADFQADSCGDDFLASSIWISSSIPDGWTWENSSQLDPSAYQEIPVAKRQSICELEGDAAVDEILNQQFKLYSSLSQTRSEVRMVQSLIPIWEEEFKRTGMHEDAVHSDPGRPLPEDALRTLSPELEFENKLKELCRDAEELSSCTPFQNAAMTVQSIKSSNAEGNLVDFGEVNPANNAREPLKCLKESEKMLSQVLPCRVDEGMIPGEGRDASSKQLSACELQIVDTIGPVDMKASDQETLRLLKWLASSQAAEDINSDDELVRDTVLSPLLPATTIDKILEKANMDYESESLQECQDILDSVEDIIDFEGSMGRSSNSSDCNHHCQTSSDEKIPQMDGSGDGQTLIPCASKLSNIEMTNESEKSLQVWVQHDNALRFTTKRKRKKPLWGSLPVSTTPKVNDDLQPISFNVNGCCDSETRGVIGTCSWEGTEVDRCLDDFFGDTDRDACYLKEASTMAGCSMRDLMRRKRCCRVELPECETPQFRKVPTEEDLKEDSFLCAKGNVGHVGQDKRLFASSTSSSAVKPNSFYCSMYGKLPLSSRSDSSVLHCKGRNGEVTGASTGSRNFRMSGFSPLHTGTKDIPQLHNSENQKSSIYMGHKENYNSEEFEGGVNCSIPLTSNAYASKPDSCVRLSKFDSEGEFLGNEKLLQTDSTDSCCLSTYRVESEMFDKDGCISKSGHEGKTSMQRVPEMSSDILKGIEVTTGSTHWHDPVELISMTFCKKPPVIEWRHDGHASSSSGILDHPSGYIGRTSGQGGVVNESLPFFVGDWLEEKDVQNTGHRTTFLNHHQKPVMGVPTHYQNDGSYLYMLTPVLSPPSMDIINRWLLLDDPDILGENVMPMPEEPSSQKGSSSILVDSQGSLADACDEPSPEPGSTAGVKPEVDQLNQLDLLSHRMQPSHNDVTTVLQSECDTLKGKQSTSCSQDVSQISGPDEKSKLTPLSQIGFRDPASVGGGQQLTLLSIEVQAESRGDLQPDPRFDAINFVVLVFQKDDDSIFDAYVLLCGNVDSVRRNLDGISGCKLLVSSEEKHLFSYFIDIIYSLDPDMLMGWDIQSGSLGFLAERAAYLGIGLLNKISRTPFETNVASTDRVTLEKGTPNDGLSESVISDSVLEAAIIEDEWGRTHGSGVHVGGRVVLNIWRLMRSEVKLNLYTFEAVAEAVLRQKIPFIHCKVLTKWFSSGPGRARHRCIEYMLHRANLNLHIMNQLDMINRTSELARVFGIDFFSVLSRGSQYRVESMFLRLAHSQNYLAISPGIEQVAAQPAMECLPLVMEPESGFYEDPVVVLDFQSLYPSMIIAYNLCFCTCLGKLAPSKANTLGVSSYLPDLNILQILKRKILLTPNGVMYVPSKVRKGVLPRLLEEILSTRIMVKQAMKKLDPSQKVLHRIFNARQLALKLIANVTYGYTAAGFSGRMPCAELADSIVQCARRTLENAISFVNSHENWEAKVIYGDTDSMFVLLHGRSVKEAFRIGHEIASAITAINPNPVTLKMEKVYHPCFLLTKKRYVGYSYESPDQIKPVFDAKGIETVRRDTCGAVSKTMEQSLKLFFEHKDISKIKAYLLRQWTRILSGRISLQDFVFAKEVRLGTYSTRASSLPPAAVVATKAMRADPRAEARYAERVPYVVVHGEPGCRLVDIVVDPQDLLAIDSPFRLNDLYYIRKQIIPALQRVFGLVGADLNQWFSGIPRPGREAIAKRHSHARNPHRTRIDYYYLSKHCILCGELVQASANLCSKCSKNTATVATAVIGRTSKLEKEIQHLDAICRHCGGGDWLIESGVKCTSLACSVFYERRKIQKELQSLSAVATEAGFYPSCMVEWF